MKKTITCYGCGNRMPEQVMSIMAHVSDHKALVVALCPSCQQKYGDHNPNYHNASITRSAIELELSKRKEVAS